MALYLNTNRNLENYRELYYNGDRRRETIWFAFFSARTYVEAYDILLELYDEKKAQILMEEVIVLNSNDALLHEWEKEKFIAYLKDVLIPTLHEGDVVIMDNMRTHCSNEVKKFLMMQMFHWMTVSKISM